MRTSAVSRRTTLLLVRFRMHLELPGRDDRRQVIAEDAQVLAYRGRADTAEWLSPAEVQDLLAARPIRQRAARSGHRFRRTSRG